MATELVIEQDVALNSHVLDLSPITRRQWLAWMTQGLLLIPIWFLGMAMVAIDQWMEDEPVILLSMLICFLSLTLLGCLGFAVALEWLNRREKNSGRRLVIKPKEITLYPNRKLPWEFIQSWHLTPLVGSSVHQMLTVVYCPYAKARYTRQWKIVVIDSAKAEALHELLRQRTLADLPGATLLPELPVPEPVSLPVIFAGISSMACGLMTVMLSAGIMFVGMIFLLLIDLQIHPGLFQSPEAGNSNLIGLFSAFADLFHSNSTYELGWALVTAGGFLLLPALAFFKLGDLQLSRKPSS